MIYILTGKKTGVKVVFKYFSNGLLRQFEIEGQVTADHLHYIFWNEDFPFPYKEDLIDQVGKLGAFSISKVHEDLTFERFWLLYNYKVSKKRAESLWNKLSKGNRIKVFEHLPKYELYLRKTGVQKAYPDTYIRCEKWEDEY